MKILVDMNLSPGWVALLNARGWDAVHWSQVGRSNAPDTELFRHAREAGLVVLTQDLDFNRLLFHSQDSGPSVILLRLTNEFDEGSRTRVCDLIASAEEALQQGALLTISAQHARLRKLPLGP